jgi:hypothetical protein
MRRKYPDTIYKTTRGNFNPEYVIKLIKDKKIVDIKEALRMLENACSEFFKLRKEFEQFKKLLIENIK